MYFQDPTRACTKDRASSAGGATGGASYYAPHTVQSYQEVPSPTSTPPAGLALEAALTNVVALMSLTFTITSEPEGLDVVEDIQPSDIGAILKAMQEPQDTSNQWIDNVPHRGIAGTV